MAQIRHVALDVGGVLCSDYWERIVLDPQFGLWKQLSLDRAVARRVCTRLWREHSTKMTTADEYWTDFEAALGVYPTEQQLMLAEQALWADQALGETIDHLAAEGIGVSIVTENTAFWLARQVQLLPALARLVERDPLVSFVEGVGKRSREGGLYVLLALKLPSADTLVVDDREANLRCAGSLGFRTAKYKGPPQHPTALLTALRGWTR